MIDKPILPKLRLEWYNNITFEFNCSDPNLDDMFLAFRTLMIGATYNEQSFNNYIVDLGMEIERERNDEK